MSDTFIESVLNQWKTLVGTPNDGEILWGCTAVGHPGVELVFTKVGDISKFRLRPNDGQDLECLVDWNATTRLRSVIKSINWVGLNSTKGSIIENDWCRISVISNYAGQPSLRVTLLSGLPTLIDYNFLLDPENRPKLSYRERDQVLEDFMLFVTSNVCEHVSIEMDGEEVTGTTLVSFNYETKEES